MQKSVLAVGAVAALAAAQAAHAGITTYNVTETFNQVVYDASNPTWDTLFTGSFDFDSDTQTVSKLQGMLSEAMTGNTQSVALNYQLSSVSDGMGGLLVSVFAQNTTDVFAGGGFVTGGKNTFGNYNAYVTIDVPLADPTAALSVAQIAKLAYADCAAGGLMPMMKPPEQRTVCMTGYVGTEADLSGGTMQGTYPITQTITAAVPEAETYGLLLVGLGLVGMAARRRKTQNFIA